jgi:hypothetical protein
MPEPGGAPRPSQEDPPRERRRPAAAGRRWAAAGPPIYVSASNETPQLTNVHMHVHNHDDFELIDVALFPVVGALRFVRVNIPDA